VLVDVVTVGHDAEEMRVAGGAWRRTRHPSPDGSATFTVITFDAAR
jgi:hypothetical protein